MKYYILDDDKEPQPVDMWTYVMTYDLEDRHVKQTYTAGAMVSTVFLGLDHNHSGCGPPILFETMIFGGVWDDEMWRYATYKDALRHHEEVVALLEEYTETLLEGETAAIVALGEDGIEFS